MASNPSGVRAFLSRLCWAAAFILHGIPGASATELVRFESARYLQGSLQSRLARERGEPLQATAADVIEGYLTRPEGGGPFPTIVLLHDCKGLPGQAKSAAGGFWPRQLVSWGYAVLSIDSFTTRKINDACTGGGPSRVADAYGALAFLSRQPFVDAKRVAVLGFSSGGLAALAAVERRDAEVFEGEKEWSFAAAIALAPLCSSDGNVRAPTLILIGELDLTPAAACRRMMERRSGAGSAITLVLYPDAHHEFDVPDAQQGRRGDYWVEYNAAATELAVQDVRRFLLEHLRN